MPFQSNYVGIYLRSEVAHERDSTARKVLKAKARETRLPLVNDHLLIRLCFISQKGHESKQCIRSYPILRLQLVDPVFTDPSAVRMRTYSKKRTAVR